MKHVHLSTTNLIKKVIPVLCNNVSVNCAFYNFKIQIILHMDTNYINVQGKIVSLYENGENVLEIISKNKNNFIK